MGIAIPSKAFGATTGMLDIIHTSDDMVDHIPHTTRNVVRGECGQSPADKRATPSSAIYRFLRFGTRFGARHGASMNANRNRPDVLPV